ncbi:hypothetical protein DTL42_19530 [Bremerella cremea]|uniref:Uncharacterized protein n=1 Tax=Bremerella cremea TaxID=1031537 RepID=A0A368KM09_9BACT|nr:hypothetical protein DTL42_19530 [Bremerella cremea]
MSLVVGNQLAEIIVGESDLVNHISATNGRVIAKSQGFFGCGDLGGQGANYSDRPCKKPWRLASAFLGFAICG